QKEVARLNTEAMRRIFAGRFQDAAKVLKQVMDYRAARQGAKHWQVIDAGLHAERWQRLTAVAAKDRPDVGRALMIEAEGLLLRQRVRYREAEAKFRQVLTIYRKVLGEQHPDTATSYNNVAACLHAQGQYAQALPLFRKALAIRQKVLGEQHEA